MSFVRAGFSPVGLMTVRRNWETKTILFREITEEMARPMDNMTFQAIVLILLLIPFFLIMSFHLNLVILSQFDSLSHWPCNCNQYLKFDNNQESKTMSVLPTHWPLPYLLKAESDEPKKHEDDQMVTIDHYSPQRGKNSTPGWVRPLTPVQLGSLSNSMWSR